MTKYAQQILDLVLCSTEHPTAEQIFLLHLQKNLLGGRVHGGAQDEIENLLGVLGHVFLLNKN